MASMLRKLLRSSLFKTAYIYGAANMLRQAVPVLLVPVLTHYLTPADYGTTAVFNVLTTVLMPLIGMNVYGAVSRKYVDRHEIDFPAYVGSALLLVAGTTAVAALVMAVAGGLVTEVSEVPRNWLWAAVMVASAQAFISTALAMLQYAGKPVAYGTIQVGRTLAITGMTTVLVVGMGYDWRGSLLGQVFGAVLFGTVAIVLLLRMDWMRVTYRADYARHALAYGLPLVPHTLSTVAIQMVDRLFITHHAGLAQTGLYTLGYQLGAMIGLVDESFSRAFQPWLFEQLKRDDPAVKLRLVRFMYVYFVAIAALAIGLGAAAPFVLSILVPDKFQGASMHVVWIALGYAFVGMYKMVSGFIFYSERTGVLAWLTFTAALVNVLLNYLLVPRYGALGAAYSTFAGFFVSFALTWLVSARVYPMPWGAALRR